MEPATKRHGLRRDIQMVGREKARSQRRAFISLGISETILAKYIRGIASQLNSYGASGSRDASIQLPRQVLY